MGNARYMKNKRTGVVWPYSPVLAGEAVRLGKDQEGKPVKAVVFQRQDGDMLIKGHPDMIEISEEEALDIIRKNQPQSTANFPQPENQNEISAEERITAIENAISALPEEGWGKGAVPYPKVNDVSAITGFQVSFQEIKSITNNMRGNDDGSGTGKADQEPAA